MIDYKSFMVEASGSLYDCGNRLRRRKMRALLPSIRDKIILEIGFGIGDFRAELKRDNTAYYKGYIGMDISFPNLAKSQQLARDLRLQCEKTLLVQADIFRLPFNDSSIDLLICAEVLEHLEDDVMAMREINRVLKTGGEAEITVPYLGEPVEGWGHLRHYDLDMIKSLAEKTDFVIQKINIFGRFHEISWVKIKRIFYRIWGVWKKFSGSERNYYESGFHRNFIMPAVDALLRIDDLFSSPKSILGSKGYMVALLKRQ